MLRGFWKAFANTGRGSAEKEGIPQGLKPGFVAELERPKAEALGYLEAETLRKRGPFGTARRWGQAVVLCVLAVGMLGAGDAASRFNKIGHELMCACGCGQILVECNHVGCPDSDRMIGELRQQIAEGGTDIAIENWFVGKYGAVILAAPMRGGFDTVAWIMPIAVFVLAIIATVLLVRIWKRRGIAAHAAGSGAAVIQDPELRERIRRETEWK